MGTPADVHIGPGLLYVAPIGTSEPTTGSGALPSAWVAIGYTEAGHTFTTETTIEGIEVEEKLDPIKYSATKRESKLEVAMAETNTRNWAIALNGGTIGSPSGGFVTFEPPDPGDEQRLMVMWQSDEGDEALLLRKVLSSGAIAVARKKAPDKATIPVTFNCEIPDNADPPWQYYGGADSAFDDPH